MRFTSSVFGKLVEPIDRRVFQAIVDRHGGDAYDKSFRSWDHLMALIFAQIGTAESLRGLVASWNANAHHHYHLGCRTLSRATLADANARRPVAVFADTFTRLAAELDRTTRGEGKAMLRLIDSTPIPLGKLCAWAKTNGRIRGMKVHVLYDPQADHPRIIDITDANINDAEIGRRIEIASGATYVFDRGYCHYGWWTKIAAAAAIFVTRPKSNMGLAVLRTRACGEASGDARGDGFVVTADEEVRLASKGDSKLAVPLRRITIKPDDAKAFVVLTNDMTRDAADVAALYKSRWQIELLFRWIKQHLKIRRFIGNNDNAIRLQIFAAMIAFALLRIAARTHRVTLPILRFVDLVTLCLFDRRQISAIDRPPPVNSSHRQTRISPHQMRFTYA